MSTPSHLPSQLPAEEFVDEVMMTDTSAHDKNLHPDEENPCHGEECEVSSMICDDVSQDQLPDVDSYKAMMGYGTNASKNKSIKKKIIHKMAKKVSATPIHMTDSDESATSMKAPKRRGIDPPEQHDSAWADLELSPSGDSGETSMGDSDGIVHDSVLESDKQDSSSRSWWKCCALLAIGPLLAILSLGVIAMTSHVNRWSNDQPQYHGGDVHSGDFVQGNTKEYQRVRHYLLNIGQLPYNRTYDDGTDVYDPSQPLARESVLLDESSPQYLAAQWLAHGDGHPRSIPPPSTNQKEYNQRYAMATIYFALGGDQWTRDYNFMTSGHICTWKEEYDLQAIAEAATSESSDPKLADLLKIHNGNWQNNDGSSESGEGKTIIHGVHDCVKDADGNRYPRALYLPHNNLHGSIPDEIGILNELQLLNVEFNRMVMGKLTDRLQELQYLRHLGLQYCNHEGELPVWLTKLTQLEFLGLGSNRFDGSIPEDISLLTNLKLLGLDNNLVRGNLGMLAPLINLESLYLEETLMEGNIESIYMELWPKMVELDISSCQLSGTVPTDFWDMVFPNLKVLDLHGNKLEGLVPSPPEYNALSGQPWELEYLALNRNQFTGVIPESLSHFGKLKHLDISDNGFSAQLPASFAELTHLEYFIAGNNYQFEQAQFPRFLIELTELRELSIGGTNLVGTIPPFLQYLSNLEVLDLHKNGLSGTVPSDIVTMTNLKSLVLKDNHLTGELPTVLSQLKDLQLLLVEQNLFHGSADAICEVGLIPQFVADCGEGIIGADNSTSLPPDWTIDHSAQQTGHGTRRTADNANPTKDGEVGDMLIGGGTLIPPLDQGGPAENNEGNTSTKDGEVGDMLIGGGNIPPTDQVGSNPDNFPSTNRDGHVGDMIGGGMLVPEDQGGFITCSCCSMCCDIGDYSCHNWVRKGSADTIWNYGYKTKRYSYHL